MLHNALVARMTLT